MLMGRVLNHHWPSLLEKKRAIFGMERHAQDAIVMNVEISFVVGATDTLRCPLRSAEIKITFR